MPCCRLGRRVESWRQNRAHGAPRGRPSGRRRSVFPRLRAKVRRTRPAKGPAKPAADMVEAALAAFAHEVRTPLTGILAISNLLATSDLDERERRWVDTIKAGAEHLASLANAVCRCGTKQRPRAARSGRISSTCARSRATPAIRSTGRAAAKGLQSSVEISEKLLGVCGRRSRPPARRAGKPDRQCGQVHRAGRRRAEGHAGCAPRKGKIGVAFAVSDSGIGLTLAEIKRLFRPFSQANVSIASRFGGRRARTVLGQAARARHGRRHRRDATPRRRRHLHADRGDVAAPRG